MRIRFGVLPVMALLSFLSVPSFAILTSGDPNNAAYNAILSYGSAYTGVAQVQFGGGSICSGALIGPGRDYVLTAAHCVANESTGAALQASNFTVLFSGQTQVQATQAVAVYVDPSFAGVGGTDANDIAVLQLATPESSNITTYSLYQGAVPFGSEIQIAGWAAGGTGTGGPNGNLYPGFTELRVAGNDYNFYSSGDVTHILYTFESGAAVNNAACYATGAYSGTPNASNNPYSASFDNPYCRFATGVPSVNGVNFEGSIDAGDSGGPSFYNGQIVGVHSYGTCLDIDLGGGQYQCTDQNTSPQGPDYNPNTPPNTTNFDFGELAGDTNVSLYTTPGGFLTQFTVPEPGTYGMILCGIAGLYAARRRTDSTRKG